MAHSSKHAKLSIARFPIFLTFTACVLPLLLSGCSRYALLRLASDQDLLLQMTARENHLRYYWNGASPSRISSTGSGFGGLHPLSWRGGVGPPVFEELALRYTKRPEIILPILNSEDCDLVLTGMYLVHYGRGLNPSVLAALRELLFNHRDARVRWYAAFILNNYGQSDLKAHKRMLSDPNSAVRQARHPAPSTAGLEYSKGAEIELLIEHLNNCDPISRRRIASRLSELVVPSPPGIPKRFDWIRESWWTRDEMQKKWSTWWEAQADSGATKQVSQADPRSNVTLPAASQEQAK